jgi:transcriptional regulator with PAS, ATPase and Fis domain
LPESLAESELFGHEKGAFTGAVKGRAGKFELAGRGTLVLDEISEMPLLLQAKLLRVLQEWRVDRVGGQISKEVDCRLVAISNRDLKAAVREERFRLDLYHRLNVIPLIIPPLRSRTSDILLLADFFLTKYKRRYDRPRLILPAETAAQLKTYSWPGNVRELENAIERAVLIAEGDILKPEDLILDDPLQSVADATSVRVGQTVREMERELIMKTLQTVSENRTKAAEMLGISIRTLRNKLNEYKAGTKAQGG